MTRPRVKPERIWNVRRIPKRSSSGVRILASIPEGIVARKRRTLGHHADPADGEEWKSWKFFAFNNQHWSESHPLRQITLLA